MGSTESQERLHYVERERQRDRTRLEGQLADAKEQLRQQSEQRQQRDQLLATVEQQLQREREGRFSAMQKQRSLEDETASLSSQIEALSEENGALRKQLREHERKLSMAVQTKDAELQRLTRRNEGSHPPPPLFLSFASRFMLHHHHHILPPLSTCLIAPFAVLGEAVTRLTSGTLSEASMKVLTASAPSLAEVPDPNPEPAPADPHTEVAASRPAAASIDDVSAL